MDLAGAVQTCSSKHKFQSALKQMKPSNASTLEAEVGVQCVKVNVAIVQATLPPSGRLLQQEHVARPRFSQQNASPVDGRQPPQSTRCCMMSAVTFTRKCGMSCWWKGGGVSSTARPAASANCSTTNVHLSFHPGACPAALPR